MSDPVCDLRDAWLMGALWTLGLIKTHFTTTKEYANDIESKINFTFDNISDDDIRYHHREKKEISNAS